MVKHKSNGSCESAIHFNLRPDIIKENGIPEYDFNNTKINPAVLDGGHDIFLDN